MTNDRIEALVQSRQRSKASRAIARLGLSEISLSCEWYRRLGMHREALRLLDRLETRKKPSAGSELDRRVRLWRARFLNLLGASEFALSEIRRIKPVTAEEHRIVGNILLSGFEPEAALSPLRRALALSDDSGSYASRILRISIADATAGSGRIEDAVAQVEEVLSASSEPLLQAIACQAIGEYEARAGHFHRALPWLERARPLFPAEDTSADFAVFCKWYAYVLARTRAPESVSAEWFSRALAILKTSRFRPEAWLDVLRLQTETDSARKAQLRARVLSFPGLAAGFRTRLGSEDAPGPLQLGTADSPLLLCMDSDEWRYQGTWHYGIPLELQLLGHLRTVWDWGLSLERCKSLLWPNEARSYLQLPNRLHQIVKRLRTVYGVEVVCDDGLLFLGTSSVGSVALERDGSNTPRFLRLRPEFRSQDLGAHYAASKTQCSEYLKAWLEKGWIRRVDSGPRTYYISGA